MKRVVGPALLAIFVLFGAAAGVWVALVSGVASAAAAQLRVAADALDAGVPLTAALAQTLVRPGVHVLIVDLRSGRAIEATPGGVVERAPPPGGFPGGQPPPGAQPPLEAQPLPGAPPPNAGPPAPGPVLAFAISFAHLAPARVERPDAFIEIAPDLAQLERWLIADVAAFVLGALLVGSLAAARVAAHARAERRALETEMAARSAAAERYQRFLAEAGHELRTPLTVLMGYVDILRARQADDSLDRRVLEGMHAEATRMRGLVEKMMTLARLESDRAVPRLLDVATAAREAAQTLQRRYPERDVRAYGDSASIVIDADDFSAALGNLLENAVKYAPESPIEVVTDVDGARAAVTVRDHGPGIAPEDREAIFERFYRGRGRTFGEGLGLGLAIVRRVVERWNGAVECTSDGERTEFRLSFPLADEERYGLAR